MVGEMKNKNLVVTSFFVWFLTLNILGQTNFSSDPLEAKFITEDVERFWQCFDRMDSSSANPFNDYVKNGSLGVKGFIEGRIVNADSMYQMVKRRKGDYQIRPV